MTTPETKAETKTETETVSSSPTSSLSTPEKKTETETEPFISNRRWDELLDSFCFGTAGGFGYFFTKGVYESSKGLPIGAIVDRGCLASSLGAPSFAGYSILISTVFSTVDSTMEYVRKKDDVYNKLTAAAACTGLLKFPYRFCRMETVPRSFVLGGAFAGLVMSNVYYHYYIVPKTCSRGVELETSLVK